MNEVEHKVAQETNWMRSKSSERKPLLKYMGPRKDGADLVKSKSLDRIVYGKQVKQPSLEELNKVLEQKKIALSTLKKKKTLSKEEENAIKLLIHEIADI